MASNKETILVSLGGSLVVPDTIDLSFLKSFKTIIQKYLAEKKFFIFVGGGKVCREYQKALLEFGAKNLDRDWMGINISRLNAEIVKQAFSGYVYPEVVIDPTKKTSTNKSIIVGAGYKPGWSTDYVSVLSAQTYGVNTIINLTNIDYVYDRNPAQWPDAKPLKDVDWKTFRGIVGDKWEPGLSVPFDPRAAKLAEKLRLKVIVINGKKLENFDNFLSGKEFIGTRIH